MVFVISIYVEGGALFSTSGDLPEEQREVGHVFLVAIP